MPPIHVCWHLDAVNEVPMRLLRAAKHYWQSYRETLKALIFGGLPPLIEQRHQQILSSRLRSLSVMIAMMVLAWAVVEWPALDGRARLMVVSFRVLLAGFLILLAVGAQRMPVMAGLFAMVALQAGFFAGMRSQLDANSPDWLAVGYALFPFALAAQLAILPLALLRGLLLGLPALVLLILPVWLGGMALRSIWFDLWLFALIMLLALWASAAQLGLLLDLLSARWDAAHDPMTGLSNRRSTMQRMRAELARSQRSGLALSVILLDIDHFKRVNDSYGHDVGDQVIRALSELLKSEMRGGDDASRWGGEEFLLLLTGASLEPALKVAERVRLRCEMLRVEGLDTQPPVAFTISLGVAEWDRRESLEDLLKRADEAMYAAKRGGRNRSLAAAVRPQVQAQTA